MSQIQKIILKNFKRFETFFVTFQPDLNLLIGDNEAGKSSILTAIDIVASGSKNKVETLGLESLFNSRVIEDFLSSGRQYEKLPQLFVEIYLVDQKDPDLNGNSNSVGVICDGLRLCCEPNDLLGKEIKDILNQPDAIFPFEYYTISFKTFSGENYTGYRKFLKQILIDNSQINNEYATREYVKAMYSSNTKDAEKQKHKNEYRKVKDTFKENVLSDLNNRVTDYAFGVRNTHKANLETDLMLTEGNINIENKGKGRQCFIKTEFALNKNSKNIDVILLEEPENHLSHINMKKLIGRIRESTGKQLLITTHSNMISTRLDLRNSILLNSNSSTAVLLKNLPDDTARFFMKAPDNNIMEFILSKKVILVEGDAEYILMEAFFEQEGKKLEESDVHIISVGGTSFKRYLDLAKLLKIRTAVIRDNDKDHQNTCIDAYIEYVDNHIKVFYDSNNDRSTFEICVYEDNTQMCETLFSAGRKTLTVQDYMLKNKADVAFELLEQEHAAVLAPSYIKEAIKWIKE
ncbi:ATP-dependent nuclease [Pedobacter sp. WC2501]|uniref:ATP-dependent nuclease n=1 Tax=Pedobacter sp. WC2501 TaxID=3461400 RepID=UPI004045A64E